MTVTPDIVREHVETDLGDGALGRMIDAAVSTVTNHAGPTGPYAERYSKARGSSMVWLRYKAASVDVVKERGIELTESEYVVEHGGKSISLANGGRFRFPVEVQYTIEANEALRDWAVIELCKLMIQNKGVDSESVGDYSYTLGNHEARVNSILRRVSGVFAVV